MLTRLGVAGWPVRHSRSPAMHNAALAAMGLEDWRYQHLPLPPALFADAVRALPALGFRGINVTVPHKEAALEVAHDATATARAVGAANTLTFEGKRILADNTDVAGLLGNLPALRGRSALVLGAGGAARAAVHALQALGAERVEVWNRTPERAEAVAEQLGATATRRPRAADVVVNATTIGLRPHPEWFKALPLSADTFHAGSTVVDMVYRSGGTEILAAARSRGAAVVDGLEILVAQGTASLERWTGRPAPHDVMWRAASDPGTA